MINKIHICYILQVMTWGFVIFKVIYLESKNSGWINEQFLL